MFHQDIHQEDNGDVEEWVKFNILFVDLSWLREFILNVKLFDIYDDISWEEWSNPHCIINKIKLLFISKM